MRQKIYVIINRKAGSKKKVDIPKYLHNYFDKNANFLTITYTEYAGHATKLAKNAVTEGYNIVVAAGGDGTINEVATGLLHSDTALGIIPLGSGNGLARSLGIPMNTKRAIQHLAQLNTPQHIDAVQLNDKTFFCVAGIGFDAKVGERFEHYPKRGLRSYLRSSLKEIRQYEPLTLQFSINGERFSESVFSLSIANAGQFGNNAYISPQASLHDGLLDVCMVKPFPKLMLPVLSTRLMTRSMHKSRFWTMWRCTELHIHNQQNLTIHLDGEVQYVQGDILIKVLPKALWVLGNTNHL